MRILRNKFVNIVLQHDFCASLFKAHLPRQHTRHLFSTEIAMPALLSNPIAAPAQSATSPTAPDRLTWIVELTSRYAREKCESHDSARLAAAIVSHLKSFADDGSIGNQLAETVSHWLDTWEPILERHVGTQRPDADTSPSLYKLVARARYA
jgi:hypothetical protein